ncbi:uncharacterized protein [Montipora capricornis]|uniref:uncharacterized protein isoform X1 n=2 Tax=Montipora capricornis TaxID=246305 RepID=UPI0035F1E7AC
MLLLLALILSAEWTCKIRGQFCSSEDCRQLEFKPSHTFDGKRLKKHVIRTEDVIDANFCRTLCYMESSCVSYNLKKTASSDGKYKCELNNATFEGQEDKLKPDSEYMYRGTQNACLQNSCKNNATCQTGFTDKGYRCLCTKEFKGPYCRKGYGSCKEIFNEHKTLKNGDYLLQLPSGKIRVYCHMSSQGLGDCGGGGWTLVMKIDGRKQTFHFDSKLWSNDKEFNVSAGQILFDNHETKLPVYWNTNFSKICIGMKRIGQQANFIVIPKEATSLHALIADGNYHPTSLGRDSWKSLIGPSGSLQERCEIEGFNAACGHDAASNLPKARIGIIANDNLHECSTCDSRIGFGTGGRKDDTNTCGNDASFSADHGDRYIKTIGYILVQ